MTDGTVPAPPVGVFCVRSTDEVQRLTWKEETDCYIFRTQSTAILHIADYKAAGAQQNVPECSNIPTSGSSVFKMRLVTKYDTITRHKTCDYW